MELRRDVETGSGRLFRLGGGGGVKVLERVR